MAVERPWKKVLTRDAGEFRARLIHAPDRGRGQGGVRKVGAASFGARLASDAPDELFQTLCSRSGPIPDAENGSVRPSRFSPVGPTHIAGRRSRHRDEGERGETRVTRRRRCPDGQGAWRGLGGSRVGRLVWGGTVEICQPPSELQQEAERRLLEQQEQKDDDRNRNAEKPEQKTASHDVILSDVRK